MNTVLLQCHANRNSARKYVVSRWGMDDWKIKDEFCT